MDWSEVMRGARYHEAGHAVAAYRNGYEVTGITATDEDWSTNWRRRVGGGYADAWREACVTLAGQLADQRAVWGEMRPQTWEEFSAEAEEILEELEASGEDAAEGVMSSDVVELLDALEVMASSYGDPLDECYRSVVEDTRRLVSDNWGQIGAVARALEQTGTLDGAEVVRVIEGAA